MWLRRATRACRCRVARSPRSCTGPRSPRYTTSPAASSQRDAVPSGTLQYLKRGQPLRYTIRIETCFRSWNSVALLVHPSEDYRSLPSTDSATGRRVTPHHVSVHLLPRCRNRMTTTSTSSSPMAAIHSPPMPTRLPLVEIRLPPGNPSPHHGPSPHRSPSRLLVLDRRSRLCR